MFCKGENRGRGEKRAPDINVGNNTYVKDIIWEGRKKALLGLDTGVGI